MHSSRSFSNEYLDLNLLDQQIGRFARGETYLSYQLWSIICLEVWYRLHYIQDIDAETPFADLA